MTSTSRNIIFSESTKTTPNETERAWGAVGYREAGGVRYRGNIGV